jgi:hypothetical protein
MIKAPDQFRGFFCRNESPLPRLNPRFVVLEFQFMWRKADVETTTLRPWC